jgi:xylose dehydrogenase (NAD/NADP)
MIRFGILGTARITRPFFEQPLDMVSIDAIASRDASKAEAFAAEFNIPRAHGSYDSLLADSGIDAVYIPLPQHLHGEYVIKAAKAGKHVLVEKPSALTVAGLKQMLAACKKHGVLFMEAFMYRFMKVHNRAKELVDTGRIGELRYIDYNLSFNVDARGLKGFRLDTRKGGGALYDLGIYGMDFIRFITGGRPRLLEAWMKRKRGRGIDMFTHAVYSVGNVIATVTSGFNTDANYYMLSGSLGSIYSPVALSGRTVPNSLSIHLHEGNSRYEEHFEAENPYKHEIEYFARCIMNNTSPFLDGANSLSNMMLLEELFRKATPI